MLKIFKAFEQIKIKRKKICSCYEYYRDDDTLDGTESSK